MNYLQVVGKMLNRGLLISLFFKLADPFLESIDGARASRKDSCCAAATPDKQMIYHRLMKVPGQEKDNRPDNDESHPQTHQWKCYLRVHLNPPLTGREGSREGFREH